MVYFVVYYQNNFLKIIFALHLDLILRKARIKTKVLYFVTHRSYPKFHCILFKFAILIHFQIASTLSKAQKIQIFRLRRAKSKTGALSTI